MDKRELLFNTWLSSVNTQLGRYITRLLTEADPHSTTEYTTPLSDVERELGAALIELGMAISDKAADLPFALEGAASDAVEPLRSIRAISGR